MGFVPRGVLPAMITPMTKEGSVNIPALRKLIDYMIDGGVHGIFAMGTTAEFYAVTPKEYQEVLEATVDQVAAESQYMQEPMRLEPDSQLIWYILLKKLAESMQSVF